MQFKKVKFFQRKYTDWEKSKYCITKVGKDYIGIGLEYYCPPNKDGEKIYDMYTSISLLISKTRIGFWWNALIMDTWFARLLRKCKLRRPIEKLTLGHGGLQSIIWVYQNLPKVYEFILGDQSEYWNYNKYVIASGWDDRREKIYNRYLERLGYEKTVFRNENIMKLKIQDKVENSDQITT